MEAACPGLGLAAALAATALWLWSEREPPAAPVAYVLCGDDLLDEIRAYRVDLLAGELTDVSEPPTISPTIRFARACTLPA